MEIQLTPELQKAVNRAMAAGYDSAEQYVADAIKNYYRLKIERLNAALAIGFDELERGEGMEFSMQELIDELDAEENATS